MGGRGGSSGLSSQTSMIDQFKKAGIRFDDTNQLNNTAMERTLKAVNDVLSDMGLPLSTVNMISGKDSTGKEIMSVNGFSDLIFNKKDYSSLEKAEKVNKNQKGYTVGNSLYATGAHEAGHLVVNEIINRTMSRSTVLQKAKARKNRTVEKQIIREASKKYGSNPSISKYGASNPAEKVAEAVSDVYTNKSKANPYSRVIVDIMKRKLKGK